VEAVSSLVRSKSESFSIFFLKQPCADPSSWKINLGPIQTTAKGVPANPQADGLGYNPRCLSRDINTQASNETTDDKVVDLIKNYPDILGFQNKMQNFTLGVMGVHNGGHYTIGGDSGMDMYALQIATQF
jgi:tyrosinase